jgi:hypothetical protein
MTPQACCAEVTVAASGHDATLPQLGSSGKGTATRRPTAGPDGLPLTSVTEPRPGTAMPTHRHNHTSNNHHSGHTQIPAAPASATWTQNRAQDPPPVTAAGPAPAKAPKVGQRTELARYTVAEGERVIYGQRVDGVVRVTDRPAAGSGRAYLVERGLETKAELDALVADYLEQATQLDRPPMFVSSDTYF